MFWRICEQSCAEKNVDWGYIYLVMVEFSSVSLKQEYELVTLTE